MKLQQAQLPQGWEVKKLGDVCDFLGHIYFLGSDL